MKTTGNQDSIEPQEQILQSVPAADSRHAGARRRFCDLARRRHLLKPASISTQASTQRVMLGLNKSVVVDLPQDAYDILVANPAVADAVTRHVATHLPFSASRSARRTSLSSAPMASRLPALDLVVERDVSGLQSHLQRFVPGSDISVELVNDKRRADGPRQDASGRPERRPPRRTVRQWRRSHDRTVMPRPPAAPNGGGVSINNPDGQRRNSRIVNLISNCRRGPGHPQGDGGRSQPKRHETARQSISSVRPTASSSTR